TRHHAADLAKGARGVSPPGRFRLTGAIEPSVFSRELDHRIVPDHQRQGPDPRTPRVHEHPLADERVFEPLDVDDAALLHDDGVLDVRAEDGDPVADRGERADVRVGDDRVFADDNRATDARALDPCAALDPHATDDLALAVDVAH